MVDFLPNKDKEPYKSLQINDLFEDTIENFDNE